MLEHLRRSDPPGEAVPDAELDRCLERLAGFALLTG
jgi:hypothetical protein